MREIDYSHYFGQDEKIRLRLFTFAEFSSQRLMFTIENLNGEYVGGVNLNSIDEKNGTFSIGVQVDRDHRGKGYGTRAINILLKYAFLELRLKQV
ncbi:GNAT family N-acetyltransferase [Paenibacillus sp. FSL R5-0887]|jgi:RimJ/RimL family protein N-acetyltransferase|uniref:GNAT family N-acetyltransferase n=2 Tax=Paenibacillus TaxID=44249 RepID=UPI0030FA29FA